MIDLDPDKVATRMRNAADRLSQVSEFISGLFDKESEATNMFARVMQIQAFLRVEAEEMETGLCCCRHVPDVDEPCHRCGDSGVSEFIRGALTAGQVTNEGGA